MSNKVLSPHILIPAILLLAACQPAPATPDTVVETLVVAEEVTATPVEVIQVVTPTPEPAGPSTLVVCLDSEPETINFVNIFLGKSIPRTRSHFRWSHRL